MNSLKNKRILFLGASTYFQEAAEYAKEQGAYVIAVDRRPKEECIVKQIADEEFMMNTTDVNSIINLISEKKIEGIYPGASEVNIPVSIELAEEMNLPRYCTRRQWEIGTNKGKFKEVCRKYNVPVTPVFEVADLGDTEGILSLKYPVVTKPVDSNGSNGITICETEDEFRKGFIKAKEASTCGDILIENKMNVENSMIAHYTAQNGEIIFSGLTDKESYKILEDCAPVMSLQYIQSIYKEKFKKDVNQNIISMLKGLGIQYGPIWIEIFYDNGIFIANEIGYRYGGSMTYYPVDYFFGFNQMHLILHYLGTGEPLYDEFAKIEEIESRLEDTYCILPIQINPGKITEISGLDELLQQPFVYGFIQSHIRGDLIELTGTTHQVFGYIHLIAESRETIQEKIKYVKNNLQVIDENGENMVNILYCKGMI